MFLLFRFSVHVCMRAPENRGNLNFRILRVHVYISVHKYRLHSWAFMHFGFIFATGYHEAQFTHLSVPIAKNGPIPLDLIQSQSDYLVCGRIIIYNIAKKNSTNLIKVKLKKKSPKNLEYKMFLTFQTLLRWKRLKNFLFSEEMKNNISINKWK